MKNCAIVFLTISSFLALVFLQSCSRRFPLGPNPGSPTATPTFTATFTATGTITVSCSAQTIVNFTGNLNSAQAATQPGGICLLGTVANPYVPFVTGGGFLNGVKAQLRAYGGNDAIWQAGDLTQPLDGAPQAMPYHTQVLMVTGYYLAGARASGTTSYAWNQGAALPPACTVTKTIVDSIGQARKIEILFYQVNDIGTAVPPINPNPPHQVAYAWYAFEVTGGLQPTNSNLIGGTGIIEGDIPSQNDMGYSRCVNGDSYWGDFLFFNTDGSLASEGGTWVRGGVNAQVKAYLYLPLNGNYLDNNAPYNPMYVVELNFGTAGMLGYGQRDGVTGDAAASVIH